MLKGITFSNKKGNAVLDTMIIVIILITAGLIYISVMPAFDDINTDIQDDAEMATEAKEISQDVYDRYPSTLDGLFVAIFMIMWGLSVVFAFLLDSHPVFFIITVILLVVVLIVAMVLANGVETLTTDVDLAAYTAQFPMTYWIITHMLHMVLIIGFSIALAYFGKNRFMGAG